MIGEKLISLYSVVWEPILRDELSGHDLIEFGRQLPRLRNLLSCCACLKLLNSATALSPLECEHFVCKGCLGKDRDASKKCEGCRTGDTYQEDEVLTTILRSYQDFCYYFLTKEEIVRLLEVKHEVDPSFDTFKLIDLVAEGVKNCPLRKKRKLTTNNGNNRGLVLHNVAKKPKTVRGTDVAAQASKSEDRKGPEDELLSKLSTKPLPNVTKSHLKKESPTPKLAFIPDPKPVTSGENPIVPGSATLAPPMQSRTIACTSPPVKVKLEPTSPVVLAGKVRSPEKADHTSIHQKKTPECLPPVENRGDCFEQASSATNISAPSLLSGGSFGVPTTSMSVTSVPIKLTPSVISSSAPGAPQIFQITHPGGAHGGMIARTVSIRPQQIRLASSNLSNLTLQGRSLHLVGSTDVRPPNAQITTMPSAMPKRKIYVSSAAPTDLQHQWPDPTKVLQYATGDLSRLPGFSSAVRPTMVNVAQTLSTTPPRFTTVSVRPVVPGSLVRPTTSVVGAMVSSAASPSLNLPPSAMTLSSAIQNPKPMPSTVGAVVLRPEGATVVRQVPGSTQSTPINTTTIVTTPKRKQEGCRCGNTTPNPGKLTCIGQRCACYSDRIACSDCKCKGCKNPFLTGGTKILHGMRAVFDTQTSQAIPIVASMTSGSSNSTIYSNAVMSSASAQLASALAATNFGSMQPGPIASTTGPTAPPIQLIPVRFGQPGTPQYIQITNAHGIQQIPIILSSSHLQASATGGITLQGLPVPGLATGIPHVAQIQQRQTPMSMKSDRNPLDGN